MNGDPSEPARRAPSFEALARTNAHGASYWSARDLQHLLGYSQWRRFADAIERAKTSCAQSENAADHHFAGVGKPITGGKGAVQLVDDFHLSRFACYLIAQNGDPRKPQSRRGGLSDALATDRERLDLRRDASERSIGGSGGRPGAGS